MIGLGSDKKVESFKIFQMQKEGTPWNRISRDAAREEEVPETWSSVVLERVEVGLGVAKVVELHELVGWGFDEERAHHLFKGEFQEHFL